LIADGRNVLTTPKCTFCPWAKIFINKKYLAGNQARFFAICGTPLERNGSTLADGKPSPDGLGSPLLFLRGFRAESLNQLQRDATAADLTGLAERLPDAAMRARHCSYLGPAFVILVVADAREAFSDKFGHSNCVILRDSCKAGIHGECD